MGDENTHNFQQAKIGEICDSIKQGKTKEINNFLSDKKAIDKAIFNYKSSLFEIALEAANGKAAVLNDIINTTQFQDILTHHLTNEFKDSVAGTPLSYLCGIVKRAQHSDNTNCLENLLNNDLVRNSIISNEPHLFIDLLLMGSKINTILKHNDIMDAIEKQIDNLGLREKEPIEKIIEKYNTSEQTNNPKIVAFVKSHKIHDLQ